MTTILGISDEVTTCGCCGKVNLKRTVALRLSQDAETVHYGSECAAKALSRSDAAGWRWTKKDVERRAEAVTKPARPEKWGVISEATGRCVVQCQGREAAEHAAAIRGPNYFAARV